MHCADCAAQNFRCLCKELSGQDFRGKRLLDAGFSDAGLSDAEFSDAGLPNAGFSDEDRRGWKGTYHIERTKVHLHISKFEKNPASAGFFRGHTSKYVILNVLLFRDMGDLGLAEAEYRFGFTA